MARLMSLTILVFFSAALWGTSAEASECSGSVCEEGPDSSILIQKRVDVFDERLIAQDRMQAVTVDVKGVEEVQAELEEMVRANKRPAIAKMKEVHDMMKQMEPELQATHDAAQEELNSITKSISDGNKAALQALLNIKSTAEVQVAGARSNHSNCRVAEAPLNASKIEHCTKLTEFMTGIALPAIRPTSNTPAMMGPYLEAMSPYFCPKYDIFVKLDTSCTSANKTYTGHQKNCISYQTEYEEYFCQWRTKLTDECATFSTAYAELVKVYERKEAETKVQESQWKIEYIAIKKIMCYVGVWMNDNNVKTANGTHLQACHKLSVNTSPMDIKYPGVPCPIECSTTPVEKHPGTQGFLAGYANFTQKVEAVLPCLKEPTLSLYQKGGQSRKTFGAQACADFSGGWIDEPHWYTPVVFSQDGCSGSAQNWQYTVQGDTMTTSKNFLGGLKGLMQKGATKDVIKWSNGATWERYKAATTTSATTSAPPPKATTPAPTPAPPPKEAKPPPLEPIPQESKTTTPVKGKCFEEKYL